MVSIIEKSQYYASTLKKNLFHQYLPENNSETINIGSDAFCCFFRSKILKKAVKKAYVKQLYSGKNIKRNEQKKSEKNWKNIKIIKKYLRSSPKWRHSSNISERSLSFHSSVQEMRKKVRLNKEFLDNAQNRKKEQKPCELGQDHNHSLWPHHQH